MSGVAQQVNAKLISRSGLGVGVPRITSRNRIVNLLLILSLLSCSSRTQVRQQPLRPSELMEGASTYLNHSVEVEILEPLYGPVNAEQLARGEYGQVEVRHLA